MERFEVSLGARSYPIFVGAGLISVPQYCREGIAGRDVMIVTNDVVAPLYLATVKRALAGLNVTEVVLPDGEEHKTLAGLMPIFDALVTAGFGRDCTLVALGGGVVGDMAGFAAACYQRGVACVQVPTTLLAQVDSSVGGKTGVNHSGGKNLIGAFHQPACVVADTATLTTLPEREYRAGLAEVIKYGLILDAGFFSWVELALPALLRRETEALARAITRSCEIKAMVVARDETEQGMRALLNLGHSFGHAIETCAGYGEWLHGEAVAAGTVMAAELSQRCGLLGDSALARIINLFENAGLPTVPPRFDMRRFLAVMSRDKKVREGRLRLVLLEDIGRAVVSADYDDDLLRAVVNGFLERGHG